jgi:hypothetical protein
MRRPDDPETLEAMRARLDAVLPAGRAADRIPDGSITARVVAAREHDMLNGDPDALAAGPVVPLTDEEKAERVAEMARQARAEQAEADREHREAMARRAAEDAGYAASLAELGVEVPPRTAAEALLRCDATFRQFLHLPDPGALHVILATIAANRAEGDPVWTLIVGPPGGGKTELLAPFNRQPDVHPAATLTEAALLSGTPKRERATSSRGGLLRTIGEFGIIVLKDFTSVLSMNRDARAALLAALREVYDGSWTRHVGTDGGLTLSWTGKVGMVAGCTPTIDSHHAVMASMGERFVLYRLPRIDAEAQSKRALNHLGGEAKARKALADAVAAVLDSADVRELNRRADEATVDRLVSLSTLAVRGRSAVERDGHTREIVLIPEPEAPARLAVALLRILNGLRAVGEADATAWRLVTRCALDSMPVARRMALEFLVGRVDASTTSAVAERFGYPTTTMRRTLEDLEAHGLAGRRSQGPGRADLWQATEWARQRWPATAPETLGEVRNGAENDAESRPIDLPLRVFDDISGKGLPGDTVEDDYPESAWGPE